MVILTSVIRVHSEVNTVCTRLIILCLSLLIANGVFGDEVKSVSVTEGESVMLHNDVIKQKHDVIMWYYGSENTFVARINGKASSIMYSDDERFKDRLELNHQTGSLTITNITTNHSGVYTLKISSNNKVYKRFNVTVSGEVSVSVREGHSVILYTHDLKVKDDLMEWHYGPENTLVARIDGKANSIMFSEDERFRNRVKRDDQTGDLMIHDTTTHHSGLYKISINKVSYKRFNVIVKCEVSVREGHSVILYTHVLKERDDLMEWTYGPENTLVARIDGKANSITFSNDERFRNRVKMDDQTGDLMIHDTTTRHSGLYKISINNKDYKRFNVTVSGEVSMREGHSVILYTHVLKERDDLLEWTYGPENTLVANIDGKANSIMFSEDERFRDRVKMDEQTGALTIHDTKTHHSGLYKISINKVSYKTFEVTIHDSDGPWFCVVPVVCLLLLICVCMLLKRFCKNLTGSDGRLKHKLQHLV